MPRSRDLVIFVLTDKQIDRRTDKTDCFTPCCACVRGLLSAILYTERGGGWVVVSHNMTL